MSTWRAYLEAAEEDRHSSELLLDKIPRAAAFHAQQAAEKLIKGLLAAKRVDFSGLANGHSLAGLVQRLPSDSEFRADLVALTHLEGYATAFRYPTPSGKLKPVSDLPALEAVMDLRVCNGEACGHECSQAISIRRI